MDGMTFFFGEYEHNIDSQKRIAIPSPWRKNGTPQFVLLPGRGNYLQLIPIKTFKEEFLDKAKKESFVNASSALALARLGSKAQECSFDKQGRVKLSPALLESAKISTSAVLIGAVSTIQIWSKDEWEKNKPSDDSYLDEVQRIGESNG